MTIKSMASSLSAGFLLLPVSAGAAVITGVTIQDVSSELGGTFERTAIHILDGSGFDSGTGFHTNIPDGQGGAGPAPGSMWLTTGVFAAPNDPLPASITFNLGGIYDLDSLKVWNYNEAFAAAGLVGRGSNSVDILAAPSVGGAFTLLGNFTFTVAPGTTNVDFGQVVDLSPFAAANSTQLIRLDILSNHGGDNQFAGLSEIRFNGTAVPEPAGAGLLAIALSGLLIRRRR